MQIRSDAFLALLSYAPDKITQSELAQILEGNTDLRETTRAMANAYGRSDPNAAVKWAEGLSIDSQREFAIWAALGGAATSNRDEFWDVLNAEPNQKKRADFVWLWGGTQVGENDLDGAITKISNISDPVLKAAAIAGAKVVARGESLNRLTQVFGN
jgi:hypothetical protein